ncbi:uncharacterized protein LOC132723371 [Ruditapes philippinarum]|uniref:uncharacterized protein LOC132723371 n=1 Tax=Ruditapes philippinarum TaxID=129788 RepID=UPI00295B91A8|nr:uncharacterized protein LOC132723371 [Ruditapes philippinarum]
MASTGMQASKQHSLTTSMASDEDLQVYCQPCDEEGTRLPAHGYCTLCKEHLCKTCFTAHKINRLSKQHTLLDATSMPKVLQQPSTSNLTGITTGLTTTCLTHPKEMIKFYCNNHTELLCSVCLTLEHQGTSCKVDYIPDISCDIVDSKEYQLILKAVNTTSDQIQQMVQDVKGKTNQSNSSLKDALAEIKKFRQDIDKRLDELERQVENAAKVIEQENNKHLKEVETTCEDQTISLTTSSDKINQFNTSKQADKLFKELKLAEKTLKIVEEKTQQLSSYDIKQYNFKPNEEIVTQLKSSLGTLSQTTLDKECQSVQIKSRQSAHQGDICVKTSEDKETMCGISGITSLSSDTLVIADYHNMAVKMVDTSSQSVSDQLQLDGKPWDITRLTFTELAVTLPFIQTIQFISISSNKLKKRHAVKVGGDCHGISCYQGKLVVSFVNPAKLQILDMNGYLLTTIDGKNIFKNPYYVTSNSNAIYVSDVNMNILTKINWHCKVIGSYSRTGKPRGMALSEDGTVFVCDKERNVIEEILEDCSTGKVVLKTAKSPYAVCWCGETQKLYYSCYAEDEKVNNFLHIYKLS